MLEKDNINLNYPSPYPISLPGEYSNQTPKLPKAPLNHKTYSKTRGNSRPGRSPPPITKGKMIYRVPEDPAFDSRNGQVGNNAFNGQQSKQLSSSPAP